MEPLAQDAVRREPCGGELEEIEREQIRDTGDPRVRRFGDDQIVAFRATPELVSRIADDQLDAVVF